MYIIVEKVLIIATNLLAASKSKRQASNRHLGMPRLTNSPDNRALFSCFSDSRTRFYTLANERQTGVGGRRRLQNKPIMPCQWSNGNIANRITKRESSQKQQSGLKLNKKNCK